MFGRRGNSSLFPTIFPIVGIDSPGKYGKKSNSDNVSKNKFNRYSGDCNVRPGANQHQERDCKQQKYSDLLTDFAGWLRLGSHNRAFY